MKTMKRDPPTSDVVDPVRRAFPTIFLFNPLMLSLTLEAHSSVIHYQPRDFYRGTLDQAAASHGRDFGTIPPWNSNCNSQNWLGFLNFNPPKNKANMSRSMLGIDSP